MVTWLISMGALNSPKMMVEDPVQFLKASLKDGVVLCKLLLRLLPGSIGKVCPGMICLPRKRVEMDFWGGQLFSIEG